MTVRTSCRTVPSGSLAVNTIALAPSLNVAGAVTTTDFWGVRSVCSWISTPLRVTRTLETPLLEVRTAATTLASSVTRDLSSG